MVRYVVPTGRLRRAAPLAGLAGRAAVDRLTGAPSGQTAARYAEHLGRSKGVLMKAGQILSFTTIGDLIDAEQAAVWQRALTRLQHDAPPMPAEVVADVIAAEFGAPPDALFADFAARPLAAASVGQVHAARSHDGRDLVVKVQYPGIDAAIRADLANTELIATFVELARGLLPPVPRLDARLLAAEVGARIGEELDYWTEAANQTAFARAYRGHPFIRVPDVLPEFCTDRVLTAERAYGRRFDEIDRAPQELKDRWGEAIQRFALGSLRRLRMFHADPHPGNYLFGDDGSVTFLDFGCVRRFTVAQVRRVQAMIAAAVRDDASASLAALTEMGVFDPADPPDAAAVLAWHRAWTADFTAPQPFTHTPETAARMARDLVSSAGRHGAVVRRAGLDTDYLLLTRINLGVAFVLGTLRATAPWEAIRREWDDGAPAATTLGELDQAFWTNRVTRLEESI